MYDKRREVKQTWLIQVKRISKLIMTTLEYKYTYYFGNKKNT